MCDTTVVIPSLNEPYLPKLITKLVDYTIDVRMEKGLSYAVWCGIQQSQAEIIVIIDADGSHPPEAIPEMINLLNSRIKFIVGSRYCNGAYSFDSIPRKIISLFYCVLARILLRTKVCDPMSGFWVGYRNNFIFKPSKTYKFGIQLIRKNKSRILEYPIIFKKRKSGESHVKPLQAIKDLLSIIYGV